MSGKFSSVLLLHQIDKEDVEEVGKKAASLGEMMQAGFPVPPGFIVTNHAFQHFLHENNLPTRINALLSTVNYEDMTSLMQISGYIKKLIMQGHLSSELIKDISTEYDKMGGLFRHATVSVSLSQHDDEKQHAILNVKGDTNVILKVREAWASLFLPAELQAKHRAGQEHFQTNTTVIVQKMILPEVSGIILTQNPVNHDRNTMLVEAVYGFSHHSVLPDQYEVTKQDCTIGAKKIRTQETMLVLNDGQMKQTPVPKKFIEVQKLPDNKILDLAIMGKKLEKHSYFPQLITWAIEKNKIYFIRTRQLDLSPHTKHAQLHATPSRYLPLLLKATPGSPGLKKGPVRVIRHAKELVYVHHGDVLVTTHTSAEFVPYLKKAAAVITEEAGRVSTAAHVSRELGIPAIIGADRAMTILHSGAIVTVNGTTGEVFGGSVQAQPHNGISTATKLYATITDTTHAAAIAHEHIEGIGAFHSDLLLKDIGVHPQKLFSHGSEKIFGDKLRVQLETVCKAFAPRPVVYSFTDLLTTQLKQLDGGKLYEPTETNPLIGFHGAYRITHQPRLFAMELQVVRLIRNNCNNIWLSVPFIRARGELEEIKRLMTAAGLHRTPTLKRWMNVSTPSILIALESYIIDGIDGISVYLDTVISLLLGVDKNNSEVLKEFNPHDPAVLWILEQAIKICHKHHTPVSVTGKTASQFPALIEKLVHWGVTSISVEPNAIHTVRKQIQEAEKSRIENAGKN